MTTDKNKEKQCVKDAFNILNDALEKNYPHILEKLRNNNLQRRLLKENEEQDKKNKNKNNPESEIEIKGQKNIVEKDKEEISIIKKEENKPDVKKSSNISDLLEQELRDLRQNKDRLFFNFETNCKVKFFNSISYYLFLFKIYIEI